MLTEGSCGSGAGDSPSITDKSIICLGRSLSVPRFGSMSDGVSVRRQARGPSEPFCRNWKEDQGSPKKNIPAAHLPPQASSLPETSRHTAGHSTRKESRNRTEPKKKKKATKRIIFIVRDRAIIGNSFHIKTARWSLGKRRATITQEVRFYWINSV